MNLSFIVNPLAKNGKALTIWKQIEMELISQNVNFQVLFTDYPGDAIEKTMRLLGQSGQQEIIIVVGGDGTVHEVAEGAKDYHNAIISCIPAGSGNDFVRGYNLPRHPKKALKKIIDLYKNKHGINVFDLGIYFHQTNHGAFINNLGSGLDAQIAKDVNESKWKSIFNKLSIGNMIYVAYLLKQLFIFQPSSMTVLVDDQKMKYEKVWFATISNHPFFGGGMKISPQSIPNDGVLEMTIVHNISRLKILLLFITIFWGGHTKLKEVEVLKGKTMKIAPDTPLPLHADGEFIGNGEVEVSLKKKGIMILSEL